MAKQLCHWFYEGDKLFKDDGTWHLLVKSGRKTRTVASVWCNGKRATWHTWDQNEVGGENDIEDSVKRAKIEAAASAIEQGFI